jgi:hypothetical protein
MAAKTLKPPLMKPPPLVATKKAAKQPAATGPVPLKLNQPITPDRSAAIGRPPSNLGDYLLKRTLKSNTGAEFLNTQPDSLQAAQEKYLSLKHLPSKLQPGGLRNPKYTDRPDVMEKIRGDNTSAGWRNPRGLRGLRH